MTKDQRARLKKLFHQQDQYDKLRDICLHAKVGQDILLKTSRTNQITILDPQLANHILGYVNNRLAYVEDTLRKEKV